MPGGVVSDRFEAQVRVAGLLVGRVAPVKFVSSPALPRSGVLSAVAQGLCCEADIAARCRWSAPEVLHVARSGCEPALVNSRSLFVHLESLGLDHRTLVPVAIR